MIIKSKSTKDLDCMRRGSKQNQHKISFSSILKNHKNTNLYQSEMRATTKYKQISSNPSKFPKKMLFSNQPSLDCLDYGSHNISPRNNFKSKNKQNSNNLFTTLINSKKCSECTASHETADSDYWGYSCSSVWNQKRSQSKHFKGKQLIRNKSKNSNNSRPSQYLSQGIINIDKAGKIKKQCDEQLDNVNTTKESIQFDMDPYL